MDSGTRSTSVRALRTGGDGGRRRPRGRADAVGRDRRASNSQIAAAQAAADAITEPDRASSPASWPGAQAAVDARAHAGPRSRSTTTRPSRPPTRTPSSAPTPPPPPSAQATADLGVARAEIVAFARRSYMQGSTYSGAAALITAADPGELIQRAALLEAAGGHRSDVVDRVTVLQQQATATEEVARTTLAEAGDAQGAGDRGARRSRRTPRSPPARRRRTLAPSRPSSRPSWPRRSSS